MSDLEELFAYHLKAAGVTPPEREFRFHASRKWRFDFAWPERMVALEVDGGTFVNGGHNRGRQIESDAEKVSEAAAAGWFVLRLTAAMVADGRGLALVERALRNTDPNQKKELHA